MNKRIISMLLVTALIVSIFTGCTTKKDDTANQTVAKVDWSSYDSLIAQIKSTTDFTNREALMHQAEDQLMATNCIVPLYYYNDIYMMKDGINGFYSTNYGTKYFMYTTYGDKKTLRINLASEPDRLDPALNSSVDGACLAANSFGSLYTYNSKNELIPELASKYTVSDDGLTYEFTLKDDLKWSDGSALTAADFEYSWKRAAATETASDYSYMLNGIAGFDTGDLQVAADGNKFTVKLAAPCAYFLDLCAFPTFFAVKKSAVESAKGYKGADGKIADAGAWAKEAGFVTSGAYTLKSWKHNESMVYVKNPYYWNAKNVKIERLEFMLSADDTAIYSAYQNGDLDFIDTVPNDEISNLKGNKEFYIVDNLGTYYVCFNIKSNLFKGFTAEEANKFRRALSLLIDRDYIVETCGQTGQEVATSYIPSAMLDGHGSEFKQNDDAYTFPVKDAKGYFTKSTSDNVKEALQIFKDLGLGVKNDKLTDTSRFTFEYLTNDTSAHIQIAECIQQDFADAGITMKIKSIEWNTFLQERKAGNYDVARNGWLADFNDPINMLEMWTKDSGNNDVQFGR